MTRPAPPPRPADRVGPRRYALALLPLALLGLLPAWIVALLCALYALGVRNPTWEQARLLGSLLIAGAGTLMSLRTADLAEAVNLAQIVGLYVVTSVALALMHWSAHELTEGKIRGVVPVLALGLIAPQPGLLLALIGGLLARPGLDGRRRENHPWSPSTWTGLLMAAAAAVTLFMMVPSTSLNPAGLFAQDEATPSAAAGLRLPRDARKRPGPEVIPEEELIEEERPLELWLDEEKARLPMELGGSLLMLAVILGMASLWRERVLRRRGRRPGMAEMVMAAGLLLTIALWVGVAFYMSLTAGGGRASKDPEPLSGSLGRAIEAFLGGNVTRQLNVTPSLHALTWVLVGLTVLLILALIAHLLLVRAQNEPVARDSAEPLAESMPAGPPAPQHRVRQAYAQAEGLLAGTGRSREPTESPAAFARRLSALDPDLHPALDVLTRAYLPVRYGGHLTEEDADAAEAAVQDLRRLLPTLPARVLTPPEPGDPRSPSIPPEATP